MSGQRAPGRAGRLLPGSRVPIRLRLTAAFALAMVLVLAASGLFVYLRLKTDLDESVNTAVDSRAAAVAASGRAAAGAPADAEEGFAQLLNSGDGRVIDSAGGASGRVLSGVELTLAGAGGERTVERNVRGIEGEVRILFGPADEPRPGLVVAVGQSLDDRDETLAGVVASFAVGGPIAVLLAALLGYALAAVGMRPVEAMRRRASEVSLDRGDDPLPLPGARDEIRRLGETLNEMLERLRAAYERERSFVADASHELRTPVAVIKTELEGVLRAGRHEPDVRDALVAAVEECDHLAQLAEDLLVVARSAGGKLPVHSETIPARDLLDDVSRRFADRARERRRTIRVESPNRLYVTADPLRVRQALGNLVDNALRHGEGEVVLHAREDGAHAIELLVSDTGPGFPAELAGRAFERFARGDVARTRGGSGLGLSIVRAIAEAHGGRVEIAGDAGGTTVRMVLPA